MTRQESQATIHDGQAIPMFPNSRLVRFRAADAHGSSRRPPGSGVSDLAAFLTRRGSAAARVPSPKAQKAIAMKDNQDPTTMPADPIPGLLDTAKPKTEGERLLLRIRVTQKCRYNASVRLRRSYRFRLFTSMVFAVGLIVIPLLQNSPIPLAFSAPIMAMMQVLLAVGILVFTVIAGKAGYELRADRLTQEGDMLKEMSRRLTRYMTGNAHVRLDDYHHEYAVLTSGKENHTRSDYLAARLEMLDDFPMWLGKRLVLRAASALSTLSNFIIPIILILMEIAFISDMLTLTTFYPSVLHIAVAARP